MFYDSHLRSYNNKPPSMYGKLNLSLLIWVYIPIIIMVPFYCYYMAVTHHEEKPYPAATITSTACHYPQDIVFRYFMLIAASILALIFFAMFRWIAAVVKRIGYPEMMPMALYYTTQISILLYCVTIGTIDGKSTGPLHSPCAVIFFVILIIAIINVTVFLTKMRQYDTRAINYYSLKAKQLLALYVTGCWIYCLIGIIASSSELDDIDGKGDKYVVIVEWNTVAIGLMWVLTFAWEWKYFNLCLVGPKTADIQVERNIERQNLSIRQALHQEKNISAQEYPSYQQSHPSVTQQMAF